MGKKANAYEYDKNAVARVVMWQDTLLVGTISVYMWR
jgi:hypothetical protein